MIRHVAVVGTGAVGASWVLVFAGAGLETSVYDSDPAQVDSLASRLDAALDLMERAGAVTSSERAATIDHVHVHRDLKKALRDVQYVAEAVDEQFAAKRAVFEELDAACSPDVIIASSATLTAIDDVLAHLDHPERCLVVHPANPPHLTRFVEIVGSSLTDSAVIVDAYGFLKRVGLDPIVLEKQIFGYVLNRLQFAVLREALYLLQAGVSSPRDIDRCITEGLAPRLLSGGAFPVIADGLRSFAHEMRQLMDAVCLPLAELSSAEVAALNEIATGADRREREKRRDRMLLDLRMVRATPLPALLGACQ